MRDEGLERKQSLNIDYTRVFQGKLGQEGFAFEHELVQFIHSILVEEPLVIKQIHKQGYPLQIVELVVKEVKSVQFSLNFLPEFTRFDFQRLQHCNFQITGQQSATQHLFFFVFHLKVLSVLISIFPLKEQCKQWDELLDFFIRFFTADPLAAGGRDQPQLYDPNDITSQQQQAQPSQQPGKPLKIEISDEYLLKELVGSLTRVCQTCPFLKSKTSSFIQSAFLSSGTPGSEGTGQQTATSPIIQEALDYLNL